MVPFLLAGLVSQVSAEGRDISSERICCVVSGGEESLILRVYGPALFATSCSYPGPYSISRDVKFSKRGVTQQQLDADWSACQKESTVTMSFAETEPKRSTTYAEEYLIDGCMAAKGYTVTL